MVDKPKVKDLVEDDDEKDDEEVAKLTEAEAKQAEAKEGEVVVVEEAAGDEDKRLGAEDQAESLEERRARRRQEKQDRKVRQQRARAAGERELQELRDQNAALLERVNGIQTHLTTQGRTDLVARLQGAKARKAEATDIMAKALKADDTRVYAEALDIRDNARDEERAIEEFQRRSAAAARQPRQEAAPAVDPVVARHVKSFMDSHPWIDLNGGDEDSLIALAVDKAVAVDGFKPNSQEYYDELEARLQKRLPHRYEEEKPGSASLNPARRGPQLGNSRSAATPGKREVFVSAERKAAMVETGIWDNPKERADMIRRYEEHDRQQAAGGR